MADGCITFGVQLSEENKSSDENLILQFLYCYRLNDNCKLYVISQDDNFLGLKLYVTENGFYNKHAWESAEISWLTTQEAAQSRLNVNYVLTEKALESCHWVGLYSLYQKSNKNRLIDAYECEDVAHEYDERYKKIDRTSDNLQVSNCYMLFQSCDRGIRLWEQ